jgi:putative tryptophan/tyrosine transport system substrate-binding protein
MNFGIQKAVRVLMIFALILTFAQCKVNRSSDKETKQDNASAPAKKDIYRIGVIYFGPDEAADLCMKGLFDGLKELGFEEGKNLEIKKAHAQGEIANVPLLLQNYDSMQLDAIIPMSTPCLTAACTTVKNTPVVFTYVYDPVAAGAGKDAYDHLPFVTGTNSFPPIEDTVAMIRKIKPDVKSVGTLYNPAEANSVKVMEVARPIFQKAGIKLEEVTVNSTSDVYPAMQAVASKDVQALWVTGDNTALQAFDGVAKAAADAKLPLFINDPEFTHRGALMAVGIGWYKTGLVSAKKLAQVLNGEDPAKIPFTSYVEKKLQLNHDVAKKLGITFPEEVLKEAP